MNTKLLHNFIHQLTVLKTFFAEFFLLNQTEVQISMPEFQIRFYLKQAIKQHKTITLALKNNEILSGQITLSPKEDVFLMQQQHTTRLIFIKQIQYITLTTNKKAVTKLLRHCC